VYSISDLVGDRAEGRRGTYIHGDGHHHQASVESYKRCVFLEAMVIHQSPLNGMEEEVV
jgi:hypothetical protein